MTVGDEAVKLSRRHLDRSGSLLDGQQSPAARDARGRPITTRGHAHPPGGGVGRRGAGTCRAQKHFDVRGGGSERRVPPILRLVGSRRPVPPQRRPGGAWASAAHGIGRARQASRRRSRRLDRQWTQKTLARHLIQRPRGTASQGFPDSSCLPSRRRRDDRRVVRDGYGGACTEAMAARRGSARQRLRPKARFARAI